jgi:adenosylcobinamide-phosphate synthase
VRTLRRPRGLTIAPLGLSLVVDAALGEPPEAAHPVVWMGRYCERLIGADPAGAGAGRALRGAAATAGGVAVCALAGAAVDAACLRLPLRMRPVVRAAGLWPLLALRSLCDAAVRVADALDDGDLDRARSGLRWLVGRDVTGLGPPLLAGAAVESVAENLSDAVVAPLFYGRLAGLPGAATHRFANTADATIGYRHRHRLGGRAAARLDDLLGIVPARMSALSIALAAPAGGGSPAGALRLWRRDGANTASPNAGRPMAAMAGALGVRLEKAGHHVLNAGGRDPGPADVLRAVRIARAATGACLVGCAALPRPARA